GLSQPSKMSDETFRALQEKLYAAGFYGNMKRSDIHWGLRSDQSTREAYAWSLALAVQLDADHGGDSYSYDQMMNERSAMNLGAGEAGGDAFSYQPDDPAKIRRLLDEGLPEVMGRALSPQETDALVAKWQSMSLGAAKS